MPRSIPPHFLTYAILLVLPLSACRCSEEYAGQWVFSEPEPAVLDVSDFGEDVWEPLDLGLEDELWEEPPLPPREHEWEEGTWTSQVVDANFSFSHALNDRTSLVVDRDGTMWLGYHSCHDLRCSQPRLTVGRRVVEGEWGFEQLERHEGIFGLEVIEAERPIAVYPDPYTRQFKVAMRRGPEDWGVEVFPVEADGTYDGFDVTRDRARFYVSFAGYGSAKADFFVYNVAAERPRWQRLPSLEGAHSAAYERGLRADNAFNLYLVHRREQDGPYGVARYNLAANRWDTTRYFGASYMVSSFVVRRSGELCMSSTLGSRLVVSCGDMDDLAREVETFDERATWYSSMLEGRDGTLFVAFHGEHRDDLRVARRSPGGQWTVEVAYDRPAYGVSTALNHRDEIALSFYSCSEATCTIQVLEKTY